MLGGTLNGRTVEKWFQKFKDDKDFTIITLITVLNPGHKKSPVKVSDWTKHALIVYEKSFSSDIEVALERINRLFNSNFVSHKLVKVSIQIFLHPLISLHFSKSSRTPMQSNKTSNESQVISLSQAVQRSQNLMNSYCCLLCSINMFQNHVFLLPFLYLVV